MSRDIRYTEKNWHEYAIIGTYGILGAIFFIIGLFLSPDYLVTASLTFTATGIFLIMYMIQKLQKLEETKNANK